MSKKKMSNKIKRDIIALYLFCLFMLCLHLIKYHGGFVWMSEALGIEIVIVGKEIRWGGKDEQR